MTEDMKITGLPDGGKTATAAGMLISRQAQEVQAAIILAKKFPRDEAAAYDKIMRACQRIGLAEQAEYTYPRGGQKVMGPSIRLAESIAKSWGNLDYGVIEISSSNAKSELMAYAWDLETNTRVTKVFNVKHWRDTRQGGYAVSDSRDIYELTANFGARRVRACILSVLPGDIVDAAVTKCRETIKGTNKKPIEDRIRTMLTTFEEDFQISRAQIEGYLGASVKSITEGELIRLKGVYRSLRDGMAKKADFFRGAAVEAGAENVQVKDPFDKGESPKAEVERPKDDPKAEGPTQWELEDMEKKDE